MTEDARLLDLGGYPEIHADGLGNVLFHQDMAHFFLFGWRNLDGIWRKVVVGTIARPISSVSQQQTVTLKAMFEGQRAVMH